MGKRVVALVLSALVATSAGVLGAAGAGASGGAPAVAGQRQPYDKLLKLVIKDIQEYWTEEMPKVFGIEYDRIPNSRIVPYDQNTADGDFGECSDPADTYADNANNAFYCVLDDFVRYDNGTLFPDLYSQYGNNVFALGAVMAHEWGHAIQARFLTFDEFTGAATILKEQQADCFTGAWVAYVDNAKSRNLQLDPGDLDIGVAALLELRDQVGSSAAEQGAHGSGFDRVGAFQYGYSEGAEGCAPLISEPLPVVQTPFTNATSALLGGNLPYEEIPAALVENLDLYWSQFSELQPYESIHDIVEYDATRKKTLPACPSLGLKPSKPKPYDDTVFYCPDDDTIDFDGDIMANVYDSVGDLGVMTLISNAWATGIQARLDLRGKPIDLGLQADCFSGSWTGSLPTEADPTVSARGLPLDADFTLSLSPGDLDEVVQTFLVFADPVDVEPQRGSAFARIAAFRTGYFSQTPEADCLSFTGD